MLPDWNSYKEIDLSISSVEQWAQRQQKKSILDKDLEISSVLDLFSWIFSNENQRPENSKALSQHELFFGTIRHKSDITVSLHLTTIIVYYYEYEYDSDYILLIIIPFL